MLIHYLKIAWRNLLKYKTQNIISVLGLALGFTAFAFTMSWIRFERWYDKHNPDADRIYKVFQINDENESGVQYMLPTPLKRLLEGFPEVEAVTAIYLSKGGIGRWKYIDNDGNIMLGRYTFFIVFYRDMKMIIQQVSDGCYSSERGESIRCRRECGHTLDSLGFILVFGCPANKRTFRIMTSF